MDRDRSDGANALRRIAEALGQPVEALFASNDDVGAWAFPSPAETSALLTAFAGLNCPQARRRVIDAAEAEAQRAASDPRYPP